MRRSRKHDEALLAAIVAPPRYSPGVPSTSCKECKPHGGHRRLTDEEFFALAELIRRA